MKRILYILSNEPTGGVGTVVLNYQRHFSSNLKIDYLIYTERRETDFQNQIKKLGSRVYYLPEFKIKNIFLLFCETEKFFRKYSNQYSIVHLHYAGIATLVFHYAKKYGIKNRIVHSHNTKLSDNPIKNIRNRLLCIGMKQVSTHFFACSLKAGNYLYGKSFCKKHSVYIMNNAVDVRQYSYNKMERIKIFPI